MMAAADPRSPAPAKEMPSRRIWVDLANSPQVLFFRPLIARWQDWGHEVLVTARPFAQTCELCEQLALTYEIVGHQGKRNLLGLGVGIADRAARLVSWARGRGFDVAVSHNSYAQLVAARLLGLPAVTTMDYEHQPANHLAFRLARRVLVPEAFPRDALRRFGALKKTRTYAGLKEEVYLADFRPDPDYRRAHGLRSDATLAVVRPAGDSALYHNFSNPLIDLLLRHLTAQDGVETVFLPRTPQQGEAARALVGDRVVIPAVALDGPGLAVAADAVFSGGGTMTREAAVLGTPSYSLFAGRGSAVDDSLVRSGRLTMLRTGQDVSSLVLAKKQRRDLPAARPELVDAVATALIDIALPVGAPLPARA